MVRERALLHGLREVDRRRLLGWAVGLAVVAVALVLLLTNLDGVSHTLHRLQDGQPGWLAVAIGCEVVSFGGYVWLLAGVCARDGRWMPWGPAIQITLAGVAATRLVATAGAGGIAVTVLGLRKLGFSAREAADRLFVDLLALYAVFFGLIAADGLVLGVLGKGSPAITLLPGVIATVMLTVTILMAFVPGDFEQRLRDRPWAHRLATIPATMAAGVRGVLAMLRRGDRALLGSLVWWAFDIATLWASLHAFGSPPPVPELVMAYLVGQLGNLLPIPGGIGGVEGGLIGGLAAFGTPGSVALLAVLAYRVASTWLPAVPGAIALARIRRTGEGRDPDDDVGDDELVEHGAHSPAPAT